SYCFAPFSFFSMIPPPPPSRLFPYTTLFRSSSVPLWFVHAFPDRPGHRRRLHRRHDAGRRLVHAQPDEHAHLLRRRPQRELVKRSEEHTSELQSPYDLVCRLLLEKKKNNRIR